jgi:hypothetical protein
MSAKTLTLSRPFPNQLIERYEKNIESMVSHLQVTRGGYVKGFVPECRRQFILQYVNFRLRSGWSFQTEMYKGAVDEKERQAKDQKGLQQLVQTENPLDAQAPAVGLEAL